MEKNKQFYESPSVLIFEVRQEGVICASGDTEKFNLGNGYGEDDFS